MASIAEGLERAAGLKANRGKVDFGMTATKDFVGGNLELSGHLVKGPIDLSAFASGWYGMARTGSVWERDFGAMFGIRGVF